MLRLRRYAVFSPYIDVTLHLFNPDRDISVVVADDEDPSAEADRKQGRISLKLYFGQ